MYKITYKDKIISYTISKKANKKNISLYVKYPDIVTVSAPKNVSDSVIHNFVNSKVDWIFNKINDFKNKYKEDEKITIKDGSEISYFGNKYKVIVNRKNNIKQGSLQVYDNNFIFDVDNNLSEENINNILKSLLVSYFIKQGSLDVYKRINIYAKELGVSPNIIKVNDKKTSWGSCTSRGNIYINYRLLLAPMEIIDYVLVHELCHMKEMNHSSKFWSLVEQIVPDYKIKRNWLKENTLKLTLY